MIKGQVRFGVLPANGENPDLQCQPDTKRPEIPSKLTPEEARLITNQPNGKNR